MSENKQERGVIPAGTRIKLYEGRVTLLEDVVVDADQEWIDKAIKDQEDYFNGVKSDNLPKTPNSNKLDDGETMGEAVKERLRQSPVSPHSTEVSGCSSPQHRSLSRSDQSLSKNQKLRITLMLIEAGMTNPDDIIHSVNKINLEIFTKGDDLKETWMR